MGYAMCASCTLCKLRCVRVAVCDGIDVWELRSVEVPKSGSCSVLKLRFLGVAVWSIVVGGSRDV